MSRSVPHAGAVALRTAADAYNHRAGQPTILAGWLKARANKLDTRPPVWESWERTEYRDCFYLRLNGTAGALAQALAALPPETTLDLGGDPMGLETRGEGLWYWPKEGSVSVI